MEINYLLILAAITGVSIFINLVIKSIDEKQLIESTIGHVKDDPENAKKYIDIMTQKKTKMMFIRSGLIGVICAVGLKLYIDNLGKKTIYGGGSDCGCDTKPTTLPF